MKVHRKSATEAMTGKRGRWLLPVILLVSGVALIWSQQYLGRYREAPVQKERDLYLPEAGYLKFVSLGHDGLVSDLVLARAMTYYGSHYRERGTFEFRHLKKLFATAIRMDPLNTDAILLAGNILAQKKVEDAVEVLKLGMRYHPDNWKFPEMIGYNYFFRMNDSHRAAQYYEKAAALPGHPPYVPSMSGKLYSESGRYMEAVRVLNNFYTTATDRRLKKSFKESIDRILERMKKKDYYLKASIPEVLDAAAVKFRRDPNNPQFTFMGPEERLRLKNVSPYPMDAANPRERLFAYLQRDFARYLLQGADVKIRFYRESDGQLVRDENGAYWGSLILKNEKEYGDVAAAGGVYGDPSEFPPKTEPLNQENPYRQTGRVVSLRFRVYRVAVVDGRIRIEAGAQYRNPLTVLIPAENARAFPAASGATKEPARWFKQLEGQWITVSGLAIIQEKQVRMTLYSPIQLKVS
jgi:tetratricopeptide (TPR) repeat protein